MSSLPRPSDSGDEADALVVGAGAAGLMTAIVAARGAPQARVVVVEGQTRPGIKILASGGGRCNVTNRVVRPADYCGERALVARVLRRFPEEATVGFFRGLGVGLRLEPEFGKLFPESDSARTVLDALLRECERLGVRLVPGFRAESVRRADDRFEVSCGPRTLRGGALVLATGGRSLPRSGSDGAGYGFARALGHTVTPTSPALVPLVLAPHPLAGLDGVSFPAQVRAWAGGRVAASETGPVLVTHFGVSGPAAMNASRHWSVARDAGADVELRLSVLPGRSPDEIEAAWLAAARDDGSRSAASLLADLPARLARRLLEIADVAPDTRLGSLTRTSRRRLLDAATNLRLPVADTRGWNAAEVTAGGVPLGEVDVRTMESRRCPGLFLVGEILDVDGRIGGFNFQWAWATGHVAGQALAARAAARD